MALKFPKSRRQDKHEQSAANIEAPNNKVESTEIEECQMLPAKQNNSACSTENRKDEINGGIDYEEHVKIAESDVPDTVGRKPIVLYKYYFPRKNEINYTLLDTILAIWAIISYLVDVGSDIFVVYMHFRVANYVFAGLSLSCLVLPSVVVMIFSLEWYVDDFRQVRKRGIVPSENTLLRWCGRFLCTSLFLGQLYRYFESLVYGLRSRCMKRGQERDNLLELMVREDVDAGLLRMFECFMEAAPQLMLQLYFMVNNGAVDGYLLFAGQVVSCSMSLMSMSWCSVGYQRMLRLSLDRPRQSACGALVQMLWHACIISTRITALVLFATHFGWWVGVVVGAHYLVVCVWLCCQKIKLFKHNVALEFCFILALAVVHIFHFLNVAEGHTRLRYMCFYSLLFAENAIMMVLWYLHVSGVWYALPALVYVFAVFCAGVLLQLTYYKCCHPSQRIKTVLTCGELLNKSNSQYTHTNSDTIVTGANIAQDDNDAAKTA